MTFREQAQGRLILIETAIRQIPATVGRLAYLAALRDQNTGAYSHSIANTAAHKEEAAQMLKHLHEQAFRSWLNYHIEEQRADLDLYFSNLDCGGAKVAQTWLDLESYRSFVPASATAAEKQLFLADLETLLRTMSGPVHRTLEQVTPRANNVRLMATEEVSKWLGVSPRAVRLWAECGDIPAVKVRRQWRFRQEEVAKWLEQRNGNSA